MHIKFNYVIFTANVRSDSSISTLPMQLICYCVVVIGRAILELSRDISRLDFYQLQLQLSPFSQTW